MANLPLRRAIVQEPQALLVSGEVCDIRLRRGAHDCQRSRHVAAILQVDRRATSARRARGAHLFPRALLAPGWRHLIDNLIRMGLWELVVLSCVVRALGESGEVPP
jgi:hypothetical protein